MAALASMASAASYLSAPAQADAHARIGGKSPTSIPALSLSSSITSSSEHTVLHEYKFENNADGLALLATPLAKALEQVLTSAHAMFGHCVNEDFQTESQHVPGMPVQCHIC